MAYFSAHKEALSDDSQARLQKNPLRILDSKNEGDKALCENAPKMQDYFNEASQRFFVSLCEGLEALGIAYTHNPKLVRGLDYYNHTVFEFTTDKLGAQGTVLEGGRYDGLVKLMGGQDVAGIGFAAGIERLVSLTTMPVPHIAPIVMIPMGEAAEIAALKTTHALRSQGFVVEQGYRGATGKRMKKADKINACAVLLLGEDELSRNEISLRDLTTGEQRSVALTELADALEAYR